MIIDFEDHVATEKFQNKVIHLMKSTSTQFSYHKENFEALIVFERKPLYFVFLTYIPSGHFTHLPTLEQSLATEIGNPRQSTGEWVVDTIYQIRESDADSIFKLLEEKNPERKIDFIRQELYKF